jgi:hypothetical protein
MTEMRRFQCSSNFVPFSISIGVGSPRLERVWLFLLRDSPGWFGPSSSGSQSGDITRIRENQNPKSNSLLPRLKDEFPANV